MPILTLTADTLPKGDRAIRLVIGPHGLRVESPDPRGLTGEETEAVNAFAETLEPTWTFMSFTLPPALGCHAVLGSEESLRSWEAEVTAQLVNELPIFRFCRGIRSGRSSRYLCYIATMVFPPEGEDWPREETYIPHSDREPCTPIDGESFLRCLWAVEDIPGLGGVLPKISRIDLQWKPFIDAWDEALQIAPATLDVEARIAALDPLVRRIAPPPPSFSLGLDDAGVSTSLPVEGMVTFTLQRRGLTDTPEARNQVRAELMALGESVGFDARKVFLPTSSDPTGAELLRERDALLAERAERSKAIAQARIDNRRADLRVAQIEEALYLEQEESRPAEKDPAFAVETHSSAASESGFLDFLSTMPWEEGENAEEVSEDGGDPEDAVEVAEEGEDSIAKEE